jgi:hypothetical protein
MQSKVSALPLYCRSEGVGPIAYLQANKIEVRVKQVPFAPHFMFAFTGETPVDMRLARD